VKRKVRDSLAAGSREYQVSSIIRGRGEERESNDQRTQADRQVWLTDRPQTDTLQPQHSHINLIINNSNALCAEL
jgi:hypothetical protein